MSEVRTYSYVSYSQSLESAKNFFLWNYSVFFGCGLNHNFQRMDVVTYLGFIT